MGKGRAIAAVLTGTVALVCVFLVPWPASADHVVGEEPYFTCQGSVARAVLLDGDPIPPVDPVAANLETEECAEDLGGLPDLALPPAPAPDPLVTTTTAQARTQILCADDDPDPAVSPANNEDCDTGRRSFEQQVFSKANVEDLEINLQGAIRVTVEAANTTARASCVDGVPFLSSTSNFANIVLTIGGVPIPIQLPDANEELELDLGIVKLTLNELVGAEGAYADTATSGSVTRRALHVEAPGGAEPLLGSLADVVVAESTAGFHGDVCPEGRVVVKKETAPDEDPNATVFGFTAGPGLQPGSDDFDLMDDGIKELDGTADGATTEVPAGQYTVTEDVPTGDYTLTLISCVEDRTQNSTTTLAGRSANVDVGPGETVTCTFVNAKPPPGVCPPGTTPNGQGECVIDAVECPAGTTDNGQGQCIVDTVACPPGTSRPDANGPCIVIQVNCPPGSARNAQGQCITSNVQCPTGTTLNPVTLSCTEGPSGGIVVPIGQVQGLIRTSPCFGQRFGAPLGVVGTNGADRITGTNVSDRIFALGGSDRVSGGRGDDCVEGGTGRDVIDGSNGNDVLLGGSGNDQVNGGPGRDRLVGGSGRDVLSGGTGHDRMNGGSGRDKLNGGYGNDRLVGGSGNDGIHTGNGRDVVSSGPGNDVINAATRGPAARVNCGSGKKDRVRINGNERRRIRGCEFVDLFRRIRAPR